MWGGEVRSRVGLSRLEGLCSCREGDLAGLFLCKELLYAIGPIGLLSEGLEGLEGLEGSSRGEGALLAAFVLILGCVEMCAVPFIP